MSKSEVMFIWMHEYRGRRGGGGQSTEEVLMLLTQLSRV